MRFEGACSQGLSNLEIVEASSQVRLKMSVRLRMNEHSESAEWRRSAIWT